MKLTFKPLVTVIGVGILIAALAGCSSDSGSGSAGATGASKSGSLEIPWVFDETGVSAALNGPTKQAWDLRIEQANENKELGDLTLTTKVYDSQSDAKVGAGLMSQVASSDSPVAAFGTTSSVAAAVAPIAQDAGLPLVLSYSGAPGVVDTGNMIFRVTAPQYSYHELASAYFKSKGVKKVAIIYDNDNATLKSLAEDFYPAAAKTDGYDIVKSSGVSYKATDLSAEMTGILSSGADAVVMLVLSQQNTSVITQLRRANYTGIISAQPGIGHQSLTALGTDANGVIYPIDFSSATTDPSGVAFVDAFKAKYGTVPDTFAAAGYDAASMIVNAIKAAPDLSRASILAALTDISTKGFTGAVGPITFENRDARVTGLLVQWENGTEVPVN